MRLPAYPLITVDPFFSIWSKSDKLNDDDTMLWCGKKKRLYGLITIDDEKFCFMGKAKNFALEQIDVDIKPYVTTYTFQNEKIVFTVSFWSPQIIDDIKLLALPVGFIDYTVKSKDDREHSITIALTFDKEFCYDDSPKSIVKKDGNNNGLQFAFMGRKNQIPLAKTGDGVGADWGWVYLAGGQIDIDNKIGISSYHSFVLDKEYTSFDIAGFDGIYAMEYMGEKLVDIWQNDFTSFDSMIKWCVDKHDYLYSKIIIQQNNILNDAKQFGEPYQKMIAAASRQVLAGHKCAYTKDGKLLYMSKECHSNGCMNTVDVSYPAVPMFLIYNPLLVRAMLEGIFEFASSKGWQYDFAPHDIGQYPVADGQVYGLKKSAEEYRRTLFNYDDEACDFNCQMPIEECGNMLIMSFAYFVSSNDKEFLSTHFNTLKIWADYLVKKGIILDNQLCTDDFAGHIEKNVNLAIKSIMGINCFGKICKILNSEDIYSGIAKQNANDLVKMAKNDNYLKFSLDDNDTWSLKYNMVWDVLFGFNLFDKSLYKGESEQYVKHLNTYGVPLDYRKDFTKSDWLIWSSCLDLTGENIKLFSKALVGFLNNTPNRVAFSDWFDTKSAKQCSFDHRTVQGGLWMPVLMEKWKDK